MDYYNTYAVIEEAISLVDLFLQREEWIDVNLF